MVCYETLDHSRSCVSEQECEEAGCIHGKFIASHHLDCDKSCVPSGCVLDGGDEECLSLLHRGLCDVADFKNTTTFQKCKLCCAWERAGSYDNFFYRKRSREHPPQAPSKNFLALRHAMLGRGVSVVDIDGDQRDDLVFADADPRMHGMKVFLSNKDERAHSASIPSIRKEHLRCNMQSLFFDFDNDGVSFDSLFFPQLWI